MTNTMTKAERLQNIIDNTHHLTVLTWWDEMCDDYRDYERYIYSMDSFDDMFWGQNPIEIAKVIHNGDGFSPFDEFFVDGIYGLSSFDDLYDIMDDDELIEYIIDQDEDFGDDRIREVLDDEDEEEEDEEEEEWEALPIDGWYTQAK